MCSSARDGAWPTIYYSFAGLLPARSVTATVTGLDRRGPWLLDLEHTRGTRRDIPAEH
jgi:hypothetical protein